MGEKISGPKYIQQTLKEATDTKHKQKVSEQLWLGNNITQRWKDNDNFNPIMKWKKIPDVVVCVYTSILQQLVPTKVYWVKKQKEQGLDLMWALCHSAEETTHIYYIDAPLLPKQSTRRDTIYYHVFLSVYNMENDDSKA